MCGERYFYERYITPGGCWREAGLLSLCLESVRIFSSTSLALDQQSSLSSPPAADPERKKVNEPA
jgi:hypothetical protein